MSNGGAASSISFLKDFIKRFIWICLSMSKIYFIFSLTKQVTAELTLKLKLSKSLSHALLLLGMTVSYDPSTCPSTLKSVSEIVPWQPYRFSFVVNTSLKYFMYFSKNQTCSDLTCLWKLWRLVNCLQQLDISKVYGNPVWRLFISRMLKNSFKNRRLEGAVKFTGKNFN